MRGLKRRYPAILLGLATALGVAPSPAATLPRLSGTTTVTSTGNSAAVLVTLPRAVTVNVANPGSWIKISTPGRFGAIVIDDVGRKGQAGRTGLVFARLIAPRGCGYDGRCGSVEAVGVRVPGSATYVLPPQPTLLLAAGTYRLYTIGDMTPWGRSRSFRLTLPGLSGSSTIRATQATDGELADWAHNGPNAATFDEHPENAPWTLSSMLAPTWSSGNVGGYPVGPLYGSGVNWDVPSSTLLVGGVWQSPVPAEAASRPHLPASLSMCWHLSRRSASLPDFWWQHPEANYEHFTAPYAPRCLDAASVRVERAFALTREASAAQFQFRGSPVIEPGQRIGMFIISVRLLDPQ
jgi:hypothetical protein